MEDLAKGYAHAQSLIGRDKIPVPGKHATAEEYRAAFQKLGLPVEIDKYDIKLPSPSDGSKPDEAFFGKFKEKAFELGVMPNQAQALLNWYDEESGAMMKEIQTTHQEGQTAKVDALKKEWGEAFEDKMGKANEALKEFADEDMIKEMKEAGLFENTALLRFMSKVSDNLNEDTFKGDSIVGIGKTKDAIQSEINTIMGNPQSPYHDASHPNHKIEVARVQKLHEKMSA
jgi:hypothetical protein